MRAEEDAAPWLKPSSVALWAVAGMAMVVEAYLKDQVRLGSSCLFSWLAAYALCTVSFWLAGRPASRLRWPWRRVFLLAAEAGCVVFMVFWYRSVLGAVLLVFSAWQAAQAWPLRSSLAWAGLQTLGLGLATLPLRPHLLWLMVTLVSGALQLLATLVAHTMRSETASKLALARANQELRVVQELLARSSRAAERLRVAREIHDGMGHGLTALSLTLEAASHQPPPEAATSVGRARVLAHDLLRELRQVVGSLRDEPRLDIQAALGELVTDIRSPCIHLSVSARPEDLDAARAHALLRCVQELITNAVKHAGAANLWIELRSSPAGVELHVRDDGRGASGLREGNGLRGMRERLGLLGGRLELAAGRSGLQATVWLPAPGALA